MGIGTGFSPYTIFGLKDIAGIVQGASTGKGLGNKFLTHIREVDAVLHVVRCFAGESVTHVEGNKLCRVCICSICKLGISLIY